MYPSFFDQPTNPYAPRPYAPRPYAPPDPATVVESQPPRNLQLRPRLHRPRPRAVGPVALALLFGVVATLAVTSVARGGAAPAWPADPSPTAHAVRIARPAIVRIVITETAQVTCRACASDGTDLTFPRNGGTYAQSFSGSGAFITSDGVILTADHVIDGSSDDDAYYLADAAQEYAQTSTISASDILTAFQKLQQAGRLQITKNIAQRTVFLSAGYFGTLTDNAQAKRPTISYDVSQVIARSPVSEHDIAVIKINARDLPSLPLAPAGATQAQDRVTALGFPTDADLGAGLDDSQDQSGILDPTHATATQLNDLLTPTIDDGQILAKKWLADGSPVYEVSDIGNHGSSGGPVLDTQGRIIGFMDRLTDAPSTRVLELVSAEMIAPFAQKAGVTLNRQGSFMTRWQSAMDAYDANGACHWSDARDTLGQLQTRYPQFGGAQPYLATARTQAASSRCFSPAALLSAGGTGLADVAHQVAVTIRSLGRGIAKLSATGLAFPVALILLGLLLGLALLAQPQRPRRQDRPQPLPSPLPPASPTDPA